MSISRTFFLDSNVNRLLVNNESFDFNSYTRWLHEFETQFNKFTKIFKLNDEEYGTILLKISFFNIPTAIFVVTITFSNIENDYDDKGFLDEVQEDKIINQKINLAINGLIIDSNELIQNLPISKIPISKNNIEFKNGKFYIELNPNNELQLEYMLIEIEQLDELLEFN